MGYDAAHGKAEGIHLSLQVYGVYPAVGVSCTKHGSECIEYVCAVGYLGDEAVVVVGGANSFFSTSFP